MPQFGIRLPDNVLQANKIRVIWGHHTSFLLTSSAYNETVPTWQESREWWPLDIPIT